MCRAPGDCFLDVPYAATRGGVAAAWLVGGTSTDVLDDRGSVGVSLKKDGSIVGWGMWDQQYVFRSSSAASFFYTRSNGYYDTSYWTQLLSFGANLTLQQYDFSKLLNGSITSWGVGSFVPKLVRAKGSAALYNPGSFVSTGSTYYNFTTGYTYYNTQQSNFTCMGKGQDYSSAAKNAAAGNTPYYFIYIDHDRSVQTFFAAGNYLLQVTNHAAGAPRPALQVGDGKYNVLYMYRFCTEPDGAKAVHAPSVQVQWSSSSCFKPFQFALFTIVLQVILDSLSSESECYATGPARCACH